MFAGSARSIGTGERRGKGRRFARRLQRQGLTAGLLTTLAASVLAATPLAKFSIPAQPLSSGLLQLGLQAHISVVAPQDLVAGKHGAQVEGEMDTRSALVRILRPSGLTFVFVTPDAVRVLRPRRAAAVQRVRAHHFAPPREPTTLAEVTVTALRRREPLQDVPIAVAAVSGADMAAKGLQDIQDVSAQLPSLDFRTNTDEKDRTIFIRGIGTISTAQSPEPAVAVVIDGVVMSRSGQSMMDLVDVDHMEILEGPQGTLFGKNASAGVINIITKNPTPTPTGYVDAAYYEGNEYRIGAGVSGPIAEGVGGLISVFSAGYGGNMQNLHDHDTVNGYRHQGGRAKIVAAPADGLTLTFSADYTHSFEDVPAGAFSSSSQLTYCPRALIDPPARNPCVPPAPNPYLEGLLISAGIHPSADNSTISNNSNDDSYDNNGGVSLQADWKIAGGYSLTSISAWRDWRNDMPAFDFDQLSIQNQIVPEIEDAGRVDFTQVSQELRILSPQWRFIDYVAGLYFMRGVDTELYERDVTYFVSAQDPTQLLYGVNHFGSSDNNYAAYGEMNLHFTRRLRALVGYREIWDQLTYHTDRVSTTTPATSVFGVQPSFADNGSDGRAGWAGRAGLQYDLDPDVTAYATVSRGYEGPAYNVFFNMALVNTPPVDPETSNAYEAGLRSQLFGRRLQVDLSGFLTDFHNYQANTAQLIDGVLVDNLINAGTATTRGIETRIAARPTAGLTYHLNALYDDAYVQDFPCARGSPPQCYIDGEPLPFAPQWKLHAEQDYRHPLNGTVDVDVDSDYRWQSSVQYQLNQSPDTVQPAYGIWNASLGLIGTRDGWSARILVKNILDQHYSSFLQHGDLAGVTRWVPRDNDRYFGVDFHKDLSF